MARRLSTEARTATLARSIAGAPPASGAAEKLVRPRRRTLGDFAFTASGAMFVGVSVMIGVAAMAQQVNLLFLLFGLCMGALLVSGVLSGKPLKRVRIARVAPESAVAGRVFEIRFRLHNASRLARAYSIHLKERLDLKRMRGVCEAYVPVVGPRQTVEVCAPAICTRRGRLPLSEIVVATRFPFGLFRKSAAAALSGEIVVYPSTGQLRLPIRDPRRLSSTHTARQRRAMIESEEFHGLRDFRRGDNPRRIHWRRSVRTGRLLVRDMSQAQRPQLIVVVDPRSASPRADDLRRREDAISAAATFCVSGLERGLAVGLVGLTAPPLVLPPVAGLEHRAKFLYELALLEPAGDADPAAIASLIHWPGAWTGHCVVLSAVDDRVSAALSSIFAIRCGGVERLIAGSEEFERVVQLDGGA